MEALKEILEATEGLKTIVALGIALKFKNRLYNTALIIKDGKILGAIPKSYLPNRQEFYEARQFCKWKRY